MGVSECEKAAVAIRENPALVWGEKNIPVMLRNIVQPSNISSETLSNLISDYSTGTKDLKEVCADYALKMPMIIRLSDQYPAIAEELELAERARARTFESQASEAYSGTIEESLTHIAVTKFTKEGEEYTDYSSAAATQLKNRANVLMKRAAFADKKRYGEDKEGQTINIGVQSTTVTQSPMSLEELQNTPLTALMDASRPGSL